MWESAVRVREASVVVAGFSTAVPPRARIETGVGQGGFRVRGFVDASKLPLATAEDVRRRLDPPEARVLGPAPLFRLKRRERAQMLVKGRDRRGAIEAVRQAVEAAAAVAPKGVSFAVDVDPQ